MPIWHSYGYTFRPAHLVNRRVIYPPGGENSPPARMKMTRLTGVFGQLTWLDGIEIVDNSPNAVIDAGVLQVSL
jgi:hypothetical protein